MKRFIGPMIFCIVLSILTAFCPVASAEEPYIQDYLRGKEITTPESVADTSADGTVASDTSGTRLALSSPKSAPAETDGIEWQLLLGGNYGDSLNDIELTDDGGYIAAGATASTNLDVP